MNFNNAHSVKTKKRSGKAQLSGAIKNGLHQSKDSNKIYAN